MRTNRWRRSIGVALVSTALLLTVGRPGAAVPTRIIPGVGIGPLVLGMRHPGSDWSDGILGLCGGMAMTSSVPGGVEISCPFVGISFEVSDGEITGIVVMSPTRR